MKRSLMSLGLALIVLVTASAQENKLPPALASLVEAERAFARLSVAQGVRASFMTYLADDGINFQPHPTNTKEAYRKRPAPTMPQPFTLDWYPVYADMSRAGDLGYTTGPYTVTDRAPQPGPVRHGYYFSVWQKQADGNWKVVVDCGISTPAPPTDAPAPSFYLPGKLGGDVGRAPINLDSVRAELLAADRALLQAEAARGVSQALPAAMTEAAHLHRNDLFPIVGRREISAYLKGKALTMTGTPIKADASASGDLGYTYGSYEQRAGAQVEKGYYVRVWKRSGNKWRVALDTTNPLPADVK
jgi:ketosteroid isomerase-like protein